MSERPFHPVPDSMAKGAWRYEEVRKLYSEAERLRRVLDALTSDAAVEAVAASLWDHVEQRDEKAGMGDPRYHYDPQPWEGAHPLDRAEFIETARVAARAVLAAAEAVAAAEKAEVPPHREGKL